MKGGDYSHGGCSAGESASGASGYRNWPGGYQAPVSADVTIYTLAEGDRIALSVMVEVLRRGQSPIDSHPGAADDVSQPHRTRKLVDAATSRQTA